jgi:NADH dehydrogenase [ubiquinone] 1 alpha subcomplex assembly factor 1
MKVILLMFFVMLSPFLIYDFNSKSTIEDWKIVDDVVMGGYSSSKFYIDSNAHGVFKGSISTENNGGFCSVQHFFESVNLDKYKVFCIRLKGDGKKYQFRVKSKRSNSYSFIFEFQTTTDWQTIEIPLNQMHASFRGRTLNLPNYDGHSLEEVAFLISNKQNEDFILLIDKIEVK